MEYIFTDCFDTLVMRREHPYQIEKRWAHCLSNIFPQIGEDRILAERKLIRQTINILEDGIYGVYEELANKYYDEQLIDDKEIFINYCKQFEFNCEETSIYINNKVERFLNANKKKGTKIYCISDYHYNSNDLEKVLNDVGVDYLDGVFSSASFSTTKEKGDLYQRVIELLDVDTNCCLMIGDNTVSDIKNARRCGLNAKYFSNSIHKSIIRINYKIGYSPTSLKDIGKQYWKQSDCYEEYSIIIYTFCARLYKEAKQRGYRKIVFLAREGYFLKKCFESYQTLCIPDKDRFETGYLKCSRRAIHSVQRDKCLPSFFENISVKNYFTSVGFTEDEALVFAEQLGINDPNDVIDFKNSKQAEIIWQQLGDVFEKRISDNRQAFINYVNTITDGSDLLLVDVGWTGRMQQGIEGLFDKHKTLGLYIGIYDNLKNEPQVERCGLIFNKSTDGNVSKYFHIFRANTQIYEQLLSAPHGSACFYQLKDGRPEVVEAWDNEEKNLYFEVIEDVQKKLLKRLEWLCTYSFGKMGGCYENSSFNRVLAKMILRSCLVQSKDRLRFMKRLMQGFSQNFQQQSIGMKFEVTSVDEPLMSALIHPDRFVRYASKLGVVMDSKGLGGIGRLLMRVYYCYAVIVLRV